MHRGNSGITGILAAAGLIAVFLAARKFLPSLASALLWMAGAALVVIIVLTALVIYFSLKDSTNKKDPNSPEAALSAGRKNLLELRRIQLRIRDTDISASCRGIISISEKILSALKQKQDGISRARQFLTYYMPTAVKILNSYARLEESGSADDELKKVTFEHLEEIREAFEKQYRSLFEDEVLDMTVDMDALLLACKRDGLLEDEGEVTEDK